LEAHFGVDLFERTSKGLRLNASGEHLVIYARAQLAELDRVRGELRDIKKATSGHVRICASQSVLESFLPVHLARFRQKNSNVTVTVNHSSSVRALQDLQEFQSDIGLCLNMPDHAGLSILGETEQIIYAVVSQDHPLAGVEEITLSEIAEHDVLLPPLGSGLRLMLDQQAAREDIALTPAVESNTYASIARACRGGGMMTFGLSMYEAEGAETRSVALLRIKKMKPAIVRLVKLQGRTLSPATSKLSKFLAKKLRSAAKHLDGEPEEGKSI
ncbi:MAG: LysR family transcriptional regulator, partial [Epibacterium sp.]|nr:LysR family transcriptional regulator [Epibacterium sp.]